MRIACSILFVVCTLQSLSGNELIIYGKVVAISAMNSELCEINLEQSGTDSTNLSAWRPYETAKLRSLGNVEILRAEGKKAVARCVDFKPQAGDIIKCEVKVALPEKSTLNRPVSTTAARRAETINVTQKLSTPIKMGHPLIGELRVWTDVEGKQLTAKLVHVDPQTVILKSVNGVESIVAFEMLSGINQRELLDVDHDLKEQRRAIETKRALEVASRREHDTEIARTRPKSTSGKSVSRSTTARIKNPDGPIVVSNESDSDIVFIVNSYHNSLGGGVTFDDGGKPRMALRDIVESLNTVLRSDYKPLVPLRFNIKAGERITLKNGEKSIQACELRYAIETPSNGVVNREARCAAGSSEFLVKVVASDLHAPQLIKLSNWHVEQDVSYSTHRKRTPIHIYPVKGFFSGKIEYYDAVGGDEYEYEREHRGGIATAWADIENPTESELSTDITVEFRFNHVILSGERVTARISLAPHIKSKVYVQVNTRGFLDNRKVNGAVTVDVVTKRK